ncbi:hypothetical protein O3P69_010249 [Scylla paramamosain]|uniref:Uncharacterized protein n=1 Tax=Scylla paramamosain TaxID=85552 RepID=A0AAW0TSZ9_SCYPA
MNFPTPGASMPAVTIMVQEGTHQPRTCFTTASEVYLLNLQTSSLVVPPMLCYSMVVAPPSLCCAQHILPLDLHVYPINTVLFLVGQTCRLAVLQVTSFLVF